GAAPARRSARADRARKRPALRLRSGARRRRRPRADRGRRCAGRAGFRHRVARPGRERRPPHRAHPVKRAAALLALAMLACGGEKKAADPCEARIDAIAARLERAARYAEPSGAPPEVPLPEATGGIPLEGTPPVLV